MTQIISFLLSVVFDMFFVGLFPEKQLVITQTETETAYYVNGESDSLRFGEGLRLAADKLNEKKFMLSTPLLTKTA